jgi:chloramphenicol-sensitive protein RarD
MPVNLPGEKGKGLLLGLAAYSAWGLMPLYFSMVREVPPIQMLFQRIVWSFVFLLALVAISGRGTSFRAVWKNPWLVGTLLLTALLIAGNWLLYIFSVSTRQVTQASLGYYLSPILSVLLGMIVLREPMRPAQWGSFVLATIGAIQLTWTSGAVPILALGLAITFSIYGLIRKFLLPKSAPIFFENISLATWVALSGIITIIPLLLFTAAAIRVPLVLIGFFQYLSPTIQFIIAVLVLGEDWDHKKLPGFLLIWTGLLISSFDAVISAKFFSRS